MIIARKYCRYIDLMQDAPSRNVLHKAFKDAGVSDEERDHHLAAIGPIIVYETTMGAALPNYGYIRDELDKLDISHPYDNGMTYHDVTHVDTYPSRQGNAVALIMRCTTVEFDKIVQVVALKETDNGTKRIKPWDLPGRYR